MPRTVWPNAFLLRSCELTDVFASGLASDVVKNFLPTLPGKHIEPGQEGPPVGLRWCSTPLLGFPRQPFEIFRRPPTERYERLVQSVTSFGLLTVEWGLREMYEVRFSAVPDAGFSLQVEALNRNHEVIPGQRILFTATEVGRFRSPGIAALRIVGRGLLRQVLGLDQTVLANSAEWQRIQVVGLPFTEAEIAAPVYDPRPQGFEPPSLNGLDWAKVRLQLAERFHLPVPGTGVPDIPPPDWPAPDPGRYLELLRDPAPSSLGLIRECLEKTDDLDLDRLQMNYHHQEELPGIRQVDLPGATPGSDPTQMDLPVVAVTMLGLSGDSFGATALGYGTVDFPPRVDRPNAQGIREPAGSAQTPFLYMVTTTFVLPFVGKVEVAALAQACALPEAPATLTAALLQRNRPPEPDAATTEAVQLQWNLSTSPQGYGIAVSRAPNQVLVLNPERGASGGYSPYVPLRPDEVNGAPPAGVRSTFVDPVAPVPLTGVVTSRYLAIGLDVFGRWSAWRHVAHAAPALAVTPPGLHLTNLRSSGSPAGRIVPATIDVEFSWNCSDRSAERIEFSGTFFNPAGAPPVAFGSAFALSAGGTDPTVVVRFDSGDLPGIVSGHTGGVVQLDALPGADPAQRRYRLTVTGHGADVVSCDFSGVAEVAYAVYARAAERIRPAEPSAWVGPVKARLPDPIPPTEPVLPVDLRWTALPDAAGRAHAVLSWPAAANAAGYIVWEGTEAGLRHVVDPNLPEPPAGTSVFDRARALTELVTAFTTPESVTRATRSLQGFSRLNTELIRNPQVELDLPGRADSIYAYRVSSVSTSNLESARSNSVALFAVPRRNQPGQPRLMLRAVRRGPTRGVDVVALPGADPAAVGFRVYRVRRTALLNDVGLMGPPKIAHDAPGWRDYEVKAPDGSVQRARAILDPVPESWHPYFYRIVALGRDDPPHGEYRGESPASVVQQVALPPAEPPSLDGFATQANASNRVLAFRSNLPVKPTPLGAATIEVAQLSPAAGRMVRTPLLSIVAHDVPVGAALPLLDHPTAAETDAMPEITRQAPDATGRVDYTVRLRAGTDHGAIIVTDPLGRTTAITF